MIKKFGLNIMEFNIINMKRISLRKHLMTIENNLHETKMLEITVKNMIFS